MTKTNEDIALDLDKYLPPIDLAHLFDQPGPVEIEVGSGKGTFLLNYAQAHPNLNLLGIEWANKYYRISVDRMRRWQMTNIRVLRADARQFIGHYLTDESVNAFHVYFPDPWPKKRHHRRRFFAPDNIAQVARCLTAGGQLRVATDHEEYFEVISDVLLRHSTIIPLFEQTDFAPTAAADSGEWVGSNFERKYIKEGRKIFTLALQKRGPKEKSTEFEIQNAIEDTETA